MAKKDKEAQMAADAANTIADDSTALTTPEPTALANVGSTGLANIENMSDKDQMAALEQMLDCSSAEIEAIATGRLPFWPAMAGLMIHGVIVGLREVPTRFGIARLYTLTLKRPAMAQTLDGEVFELPPGENISVLERTVLKELATREGQEVGILCAGKKQGSGKFAYWDYKIVGVRRTPDQIQAAAQMAMARMQARALPAASPSKG